jgi:hypothetical protein
MSGIQSTKKDQQSKQLNKQKQTAERGKVHKPSFQPEDTDSLGFAAAEG